MIMDELNKPLEELDPDFIKKKVKAVTFDLDVAQTSSCFPRQ